MSLLCTLIQNRAPREGTFYLDKSAKKSTVCWHQNRTWHCTDCLMGMGTLQARVTKQHRTTEAPRLESTFSHCLHLSQAPTVAGEGCRVGEPCRKQGLCVYTETEWFKGDPSKPDYTYHWPQHKSGVMTDRCSPARPHQHCIKPNTWKNQDQDKERVQDRGRMQMSYKDSLKHPQARSALCPLLSALCPLPSAGYYDLQPPHPTAQLQGELAQTAVSHKASD